MNLLLHAVTVPLFMLASAFLVVAMIRLWAVGAIATVAAAALAVAVQRRGHRREPAPPEPFTGPANAIARLVAEQWVTFPRFVLARGCTKPAARAEGW